MVQRFVNMREDAQNFLKIRLPSSRLCCPFIF